MSSYQDGDYKTLIDESSPIATSNRKNTLLLYVLCGVFVVLAIAVLIVAIASINESSIIFKTPSKNDPARFSIVPAQKQCAASAVLDYVPFYPAVGTNVSSQGSYGGKKSDGITKLIINANLITMDPSAPAFVLQNYQMLVRGDGTLGAIAEHIDVTPDMLVIDAQGGWVLPGIVDTHSHAGVYSYPEDSVGTSDGNEMTNPSWSQIRALDAFDAEDPAIPLIRAGGVTTALVLPGSGDVTGGQSQVFKYRNTTKTSEMFLEGSPRGAKFACGENPKRYYGGKGVLPMSRMGIGYEVRSKFFRAAQVTQEQAQWDCQNATGGQVLAPRPFSIEYETLQGILAGEVDMHNHCYEVQDLQMMMRTANEFGFRVRAFHHALEAWKIADEVASHGAAVAIFADHWGFKMEAYDGSVYGPKVLVDAGVRVALKSDHPVIQAWRLIHEAAIANYYGLTDEQALAAITRVPAEIIRMQDRMGTLTTGKDADFAIWDRYPLEIGAQTTQVFVEGVRLVNQARPIQPRTVVNEVPFALEGVCAPENSDTLQSLDCYALQGGQVYTLDGTDEAQSMNIVVENGVVSCFNCTVPASCNLIDVTNLVVVPAFVQVGTNLGLVEVTQESQSQDGTLNDVDQRFLRAIDGVRLNIFYKRHLSAAYKAGVLTHVVHPQNSVLVNGQIGAYRTIGTVITDAVIQDSVALSITVGQDAKRGGAGNSISSQILQLRKYLTAAQAAINGSTADPTDPFVLALLGQLPILLHSDNADETAHIIRLKQQFGFSMVLFGGSESYLIAETLAAENIPVILYPPAPHPNTFSTWEFIESLPAYLASKGVTVGLATDQLDRIRNLRWDAGIQAAQGFTQALRSITTVPAQIFGLDQYGVGVIRVGTPAGFSVFSADPLTFFGHIKLVASRDTIICSPIQY